MRKPRHMFPFSDDARAFVRSLERHSATPLQTLMPNASQAAVDLLQVVVTCVLTFADK
jgi:hypothetical protein